MLNYLWAGMTLTGILWGALHGQMTAVTDGAIQASKEAVTLCITMLGVMTLWTGVLEIGHRSGLVDQLARKMGPVLTFLFPRLDPDGEARKQISVNMIANILGLGWAATPAGLKAMEELKKVEKEKIVVGDGARLCYNTLTEQGITLKMAPEHLRMQSAWGVARAALELVRSGGLVSGEELAPVYCRLSQAERERLEREAKSK